MDFLGLKNLTIIQNTLRIVKKIRNIELNVNDIPEDDAETFKLLQEARTTGVFQLESSGMKRYLKLLKPNVFEDIIAMVALYRPGPMDWIPDFIARKHGERKIEYLHPVLKPILEKTYGVAVYQEQVMQIAQALAGFSLGEADVLRKAMGKKVFALIQEQKNKFIEGCINQKVSSQVAEKVFAYIEPFAGYGFNRSHAACYAMVGYQTAYLKAHFPAEFMAALLTSDQDNIDRVAIEVAECREMGIEVLPPDINESFEEFAVIADSADPSVETQDIASLPGVAKKHIRFGLNAIKNVGHTVAHEIVEERKRGGKFQNFTEFIERVRHKDLNKKSIEALAKVGALDQFAERNAVIASIENIIMHSKNMDRLSGTNQGSLFSLEEVKLPEIKLEQVAPAEKKDRLTWEKELIGLYISDHPVKEYQEYFARMAVPIKDIGLEHVNQNISIGGVISTIKKIYLKNQKMMAFVTIEDMDSRMEILVFPKTLDETGSIWVEDKIILATGKLSNKDGEFKLLADSVKAVTPTEMENFARVLHTQKQNGHVPAPAYAPKKIDASTDASIEASKNIPPAEPKPKITISLPAAFSQTTLKDLSALFDRCDLGSTKVYLNIGGKKIETPYCVKNVTGLQEKIQGIIGDGKVFVSR